MIGSRGKILLIDDEPDAHGPFKMKLEEHGYEVWMALDGLEAQRLIQKERPDLLIMETALPGLNGEGLLEWLHSQKFTPFPKVIIATVIRADDRNMKRILKNFDIAYHMAKPIGVKELLRNVDSILDQSESRSQKA